MLRRVLLVAVVALGCASTPNPWCQDRWLQDLVEGGGPYDARTGFHICLPTSARLWNLPGAAAGQLYELRAGAFTACTLEVAGRSQTIPAHAGAHLWWPALEDGPELAVGTIYCDGPTPSREGWKPVRVTFRLR